MTKKILILLLTGLFLSSGLSFAQVRGLELYELMTTERLITSEGTGFFRWHPNKAVFLERDGDKWIERDPVTEQTTQLFSDETLAGIVRHLGQATGQTIEGAPFGQFDFVSDGKAITFDHSDRYFLFNLETSELRELLRPEVEKQPFTDGLMRNMPGSQLWNGEYSPDFNYFAYVKGYDLYLVDTRTGAETRITTDGNENIFNGRPNWVYPEEFSQLTAYWFSPDSKKLAFYRSDESAVHKYPLVHDLTFEAQLEEQSYPKAGEPNPSVEIHIYDIASSDRVRVDIEGSPDVYYIRPEWLHDASGLTFRRLNRNQNELKLLVADPASGYVTTVLTETDDAFINVQDDFYQMDDGEHYLWSDELTGWRHIALLRNDGSRVRYLTSGEWQANGITCVDESNGWVYLTGNDPDGLESHLFRVKLDGSGFVRLTKEAGSHRVSMDPTCSFYTDNFSSFESSGYSKLYRADGTEIRTLMTTDASELESLGLEPPELVTFLAADGETELHGILYKPAGYDPETPYPLLVSVYGGPHSKSIRNSYQMNSGLQALAQLGYMVWTADNRGLTSRGKEFETETYLKLGQIDLDDQAAGVMQIAKRTYVDGSRVGIFGHSYGGYMSSLALVRKPDVFHVGVAGAPVTDWRSYDTIYTERYMRTPQENKEGYDVGSVLTYADKLQGKLLLIHGTIDNNVHPGNTMQLINALVEANKIFDVMVYPDNRHGIRGAAGRHYRDLRMSYFEKHLKPQPVSSSGQTH